MLAVSTFMSVSALIRAGVVVCCKGSHDPESWRPQRVVLTDKPRNLSAFYGTRLSAPSVFWLRPKPACRCAFTLCGPSYPWWR